MAQITDEGGGGRRIAARRDAALIVGVALSATIICVKFDVSEALLGWTRLHERLQLDELPAILLVVATCLVWFSSRRYAEAQRELALRRAAEGKLAAALAENQRLAHQYVDMREYERKALARDLHDELGQYLNVIKLDAVAIRDATESRISAVSATARALIETVDRVYGVVAGLISQLRPVGFDDLGVGAAIEHCIGDWRARLPGTTIGLSIEADLGRLDELRALTLFRLVQEALTNVARHSGATLVEVRISERWGSGSREIFDVSIVDVSIVDNGCGTDIDARRTGLGLVGMRERVAAFLGTLELASAPGGGFKITASLPVAATTRP